MAPVISGTVATNEILTATTGTWEGTDPITYTYSWESNSDGETWVLLDLDTSTYTVLEEDITKSIRVVVTATDSTGTETAESNVLTA